MASRKVEDGEAASERIETVAPPPRLPGVDIIRVSLTWGILLFHTAVAYAPGASYYVKSFGWSTDVFSYLSFTWFVFMDVWQMPMFFFLSGISAFYALFRRSDQQFRDERTHRLLVPYFLLAILNGVYSITFYAPRTPFCDQYYEEGEVYDDYGLPWKHCETFWKYTQNETYPEYLMKHYLGGPNAGQGWFLLYLFIYSQVFARIFICWHPAHTTSPVPCCTRPTSALGKYLQGFHFFGRPAADPQEFVSAVQWWLGGTLRLGLVPVLWLLIPEIFMRPWMGGQLGNPFWDWPNNINYTFIFVFGFGIAAAEEHGLKDVLHRGRWFYLVAGCVLSGIKSWIFKMEQALRDGPYYWTYQITNGTTRAFGEWLFVLGAYAVARTAFTSQYRHLPLLNQVAMPFYLTHQQVLVAVLSGALWVPYLSTFPSTLLLATLATFLVSLLITKLGPIRYLFGLPPPKGSWMPGNACRGFLPCIFLAITTVLLLSSVNIYHAYGYCQNNSCE